MRRGTRDGSASCSLPRSSPARARSRRRPRGRRPRRCRTPPRPPPRPFRPARDSPTALRFPRDAAARSSAAPRPSPSWRTDRAWALDPDTNELSLPLPPGGPRSVLVGTAGRSRPARRVRDPRRGRATRRTSRRSRRRSRAFDWGHPIGLAVAFADGKGNPRKRFVDDGHLLKLDALPPGTYLHVAYHPSGLALGVRGGDRRGAGDLAVDERGRGSATADLLEARHDVHLARLLSRTESGCGGRPSTRRAIPSCTS